MGTTQTFHQKIIQVQKTINVPKGNFNSFGGYNYRTCEDILSALRKILPDLDLLVNICDVIELQGDRYYVKAIVSITDGKDSISTTGYARESLAKKGMDESQITGTASSYARKYALAGLLGLDDGREDADAGKLDDLPPNKEELIELRKRLKDTGKTEQGLLDYLSEEFKTTIKSLDSLTGPQFLTAIKAMTAKKKEVANASTK